MVQITIMPHITKKLRLSQSTLQVWINIFSRFPNQLYSRLFPVRTDGGEGTSREKQSRAWQQSPITLELRVAC